MARLGRGRSIGGLALLAMLAACGGSDAPPPDPGDEPVRLSFEDRPEPDVFRLEGPGTRDGPEGTAGLWTAVVGLKHPERGLVVNTRNHRKVVTALFTARAGTDPAIRLSNEAADALGIGDDPSPVSITALRREPRLDTTKGRF